MKPTSPRIGLFTPPDHDTFNWNTPPGSLVQRRYLYDRIGQRATPANVIEVVSIRIVVQPSPEANLTHHPIYPHHRHEFAMVHTAEANVSPPDAQCQRADIRHENFYEHVMDDQLVSRNGWGHCSATLYGDVIITPETWSKPGKVRLRCHGYPAARMLWVDSYCCGAPLHKIVEHVDYSTLSEAVCTKCGANWHIGDGLHFQQV